MNSKILLVKNIHIDKQYINVLSYTEAQMLELCQANLVAQADNYSFLRPTGSIMAGFTYAQCLQANYIAFQNPDYTNKWFFAWIDDVIYKGDRNTEITFTIDVWSTWFSYWNKQNCYVLRHHVNDDVAGNYTQPEGLETGEYISDGMIKVDELTSMSYIIQVSEWVNASENKPLATNYGGVYSAGGAYICPDITSVVNILNAFQDGRADAILNVYMCPTYFISNTNSSLQYSGQSIPIYLSKYINKPTSIDGYTPKNKKLLTFPYCFLNLSNNNGSVNSYMYELFEDDNGVPNNQVLFNIKGVPTVGSSSKCVPYAYKIYGNDNEDEGIIGGKFPTLSWSEDAYINWLTQNSVNIGIGVASNLLTILGGAGMIASGGGATAGASAIVSGSLGIASQIGQIYQHSITPNVAKGNTNGGDINSSSDTNTFYFYKMNIRAEYARIIDDYFSRYGYKINRITSPNITGRPIFNYVEIGSSECIGYGDVPSKYMDIINRACRKGVTIWHNHSNLGNYSLNNQ